MLLKPAEVRKTLGICNNTLIKLRRQNELKYKKIGSHYRYTKKSVDDFENQSSLKEKEVQVKVKSKHNAVRNSVKLNHYWT